MEDSTVTSEVRGEALLITLGGRFDGASGGEAVDAARSRGKTRVVLHLGGVDYMSSSGLSMILKLKTMYDLRLLAVPAGVREILELSGVVKLVRIFDDETSALEAEDAAIG